MRNSFPGSASSASGRRRLRSGTLPPRPPVVATPVVPAPAAATSEKRQHLRFDKVFPVRVESILFGDTHCVARNVSAGGIFLETADPLPLGARVRVCFLTPDEAAEIVAVGEVKNHYFVNYVQDGDLEVGRRAWRCGSCRFEQESQHVAARLPRSLPRPALSARAPRPRPADAPSIGSFSGRRRCPVRWASRPRAGR